MLKKYMVKNAHLKVLLDHMDRVSCLTSLLKGG